MSGKVIMPPDIIEAKGPLIFLAGPIQGAYDWQSEAIKQINSLNPQINIANPRRDYLDDEFDYAKQVDWETKYLRRAEKNGVILFWLAKETNHVCERAYAQTSRFELGEWKVRHEKNGAKLVVGIEEGFTNRKYIQRRLSQDCPEIHICSSLKETCAEAVRLAQK